MLQNYILTEDEHKFMSSGAKRRHRAAFETIA